MKKFIVVYHASKSAMEVWSQGASPEEMQAGMEAWMAWAASCGDGLADMGSPLGNGQKMTQAATGPSDRGVIGYSVLQCDDMEAALGLLEGHPHLAWVPGCEIEVHESMVMPG